MTTQAPNDDALPEIGYPRLVRLVSDPIYPQAEARTAACPHCQKAVTIPVPVAAKEPVTWIIGGPHPLLADMKVIAMYLVDDGVDVYSVALDGKSGIRNFVPSKTMRLTQDTMPLHVFAKELNAAETGEDDDEGEDEPEEPEEPAVVPNGSNPS